MAWNNLPLKARYCAHDAYGLQWFGSGPPGNPPCTVKRADAKNSSANAQPGPSMPLPPKTKCRRMRGAAFLQPGLSVMVAVPSF
jgi:hypothetical protein